MTTKPYLTLCILAKHEICALTVGCLTNAVADPTLSERYQVLQQFAIGQSDLPKVRSEQLTHWFQSAQPDDLFLFIDADQTFLPSDILNSCSLASQYEVVCGAYAKKTNGITVQPKDVVAFYTARQGELWYGSTGFMLITYRIAKTLADHFGSQTRVGVQAHAYPFFLERIVDDKELGETNVWLSEDFSFCWLARQFNARLYGYISRSIGHIVPIEKYITIPPTRQWNDRSIVYYCNHTPEPWSPLSIGKGIGGSETAVIKLSAYWAKAGYEVTVFCHCKIPGTYDGVVYKNFDQFSALDSYNILVVWRSLKLLRLHSLRAKKILIDLHDVIRPEEVTELVATRAHGFLVKSNYQASMLLPTVPTEKIHVIPNGGAYEYSFPEEKRDPNYLIYASSYDRGLPYMLKWGWPRIKQACPDAYLKLFYGWNGFDLIDGDKRYKDEFKQGMLRLMSQDGVTECGRISQEDLAREKSKASIHYYIGDFQEIDCISVRESAYLGAIPVVSREAHVFKEKESYCLLVDGDPTLQETHEHGADRIIQLLKNQTLTETTRNGLRVPRETWEEIANKWMTLF